MSGHLVGSAAFKAVGTGDPRPAGSIPVHLRSATGEPDIAAVTRVRPMKRLLLLLAFIGAATLAIRQLKSA